MVTLYASYEGQEVRLDTLQKVVARVKTEAPVAPIVDFWDFNCPKISDVLGTITLLSSFTALERAKERRQNKVTIWC